MSGEHLTSKQNPSGELFKPVACTTPLNPCTFCGWPAELYQRTNAEGTYSQKAVMCSNFGGDDPTGDACPLHLPPEDFYHATKREAVEYWNERTARGIEKAKVLLEARRPSEATGLQPVRRWNAKYPGISMLEHNGELIRSGFGPYVLAEDYDRVAALLSEAVRMIEGYRRAGFITNPAALEQASDFALRAGNSHHE